MDQITLHRLSTEQGKIEYTLERKPVKNINLRIKKDGSVYVSANRRVPLAQIEAFICKEMPMIRSTRSRLAEKAARSQGPRRYVSGEIFKVQGQSLVLRVQQGLPEQVLRRQNLLVMTVENPGDDARRKRLMDKWWNEECRRVYGEIMRQILPAFSQWGVMMPALRLRDMTSRWGTCMPQKKVITLNKRLLCAPLPCIQYVVLHEFCHFIHPNHSACFWALVSSFMPDWKERRKLLEETADF